MTNHDDKLSRRYRELAREEPPVAIDAAILAASKRAVKSKPGTDPEPGKGVNRGLSRWAGPVSIAAVLVLGIGVSLRMQMEQPGIETAAPSSGASEYSLPSIAEPATEPTPSPSAASPVPATPAATTFSAPAPAPAAAPPAPAAAAAPQMSPQSAPLRAKRELAASDAAGASELRKSVAADPDPARELERIAKLRESGNHAEADRALAEFRRRHPDFRIPEALWERVRAR